MKVVGLVTEYNPFHNGHKYHIEEAKRCTGADYVIAIMSGNFVQRGTPAIIDKYHRTEMALQNGVDLVLELPVCYATASAEFFAHGAVSILNKLGIVDSICFGSECGDIELLKEAAQFLLNAPESFEEYLLSFIKEGLTYPAARMKALKHYLKDNHVSRADELSQVLTEPNNILGIEYMKALLRLDSDIKPVTIKRISAHYHDVELGIKGNSLEPIIPIQNDILLDSDSLVISSATAIRKAIQNNSGIQDSEDYFNELQYSVPKDVYQLLKSNYQKTYPVTEDDFLGMLQYKLLSEEKANLTDYLDITGDLAVRMKNTSDYYPSFAELTNYIKTKNMTLTRINRACLHLLLNLKVSSFNEFNENGYAQYARVLGVRKQASHLLRKVEKEQRIPIITKVSKAESKLSPLSLRMLKEDLFAAHLYNQVVYTKHKTKIANEYKHGIVIL